MEWSESTRKVRDDQSAVRAAICRNSREHAPEAFRKETAKTMNSRDLEDNSRLGQVPGYDGRSQATQLCSRRSHSYVRSLVATLLTVGRGHLSAADNALVLVVVTVAVASAGHRGPAALAALVSAASFDFFAYPTL